jgi:hypothetical protein
MHAQRVDREQHRGRAAERAVVGVADREVRGADDERDGHRVAAADRDRQSDDEVQQYRPDVGFAERNLAVPGNEQAEQVGDREQQGDGDVEVLQMGTQPCPWPDSSLLLHTRSLGCRRHPRAHPRR